MIDSAKKLAELGFYVFPVRVNGKRPAVTKFFDVATRDDSEIEKLWGTIDYNVGISTTTFKGGGLLVVDIDVKHDGFTTLGFLEDMGRVFPETLCVKTASGGRHMFYWVPEAVSQSAGTLLGKGLDTRSYHGYVVGPGSAIDGSSYSIENLTTVAAAPEWLIEIHKRAPKLTPGLRLVEDVNEELAERRAIEFLERLEPAGEGQRNHKCFAAAAKIKDFGLSRDRANFVMSAYWKSEPALGLEEIEHTVTAAYNYGQNTIGIDSPEAAFTKIEVDPNPTNPAPKNPMERLNDEYAFVVAGGGAQVLWFTTNSEEQKRVEHLSIETFKHKLANQKLRIGEDSVPISRVWLSSPERRQYDGIVFEPNKTNPRFYNKWQGFTCAPLEGKPTTEAELALSLFHTHITRNLCGGNKEHADWIFGWFAHIFQKPQEKARTALVLRGKKGTGKSAIFILLRRLLGEHFFSVANRRYLTGNFNGHLEAKLLYVLEEAFWSGDKSTDGILKDLVTGEMHVIERKGREAYEVKNLCRVVVLGNEDWVVPATEDERRYAVFDVSNENRGDDQFFGSMIEGMDPRLLLKFFLEFDLSKVNINKIPFTDALLKQKEQSQTPFVAWWRECLRTGHIVGSGLETWPKDMIKNELRSAFAIEAREQNIGGRMPSEEWIGRHLKNIAPGVKVTRLGTGEARRRFYVFPTLDEARKQWEGYIGHKVEWEAEDE